MAIWLNSLIVPVSNEAIGVGVWAGAWLSGKRPDQRGFRDVG
jgi:sulfopyruvate decarboxylase TPP-binding subunit